MSEKLTGLCPNCGSKLVYDGNEKTVMCYVCDSVVSMDQISGGRSAGVGSVGLGGYGAVMPAALMGFDNPESGVVFIENFFDNYDWIGYIIDPEIAIPEIAEVVANNKMKNGACGVSWYLDYKALAYPVRKKIEGLGQHQKAMAGLYNPLDPTGALELFDSYRRICLALKEGKADIFKQLETAIKYAERFSLESAKLNEMKSDFANLKALFEQEVVVVKDIDEIPAYAQAREEASKKIAAELAEKGIDATATYQQAVEAYNSSSTNKALALSLFEKIRGYEDSVRYIKKINSYFEFEVDGLKLEERMYRAFGKYFIYKEEEYTEALDLKSLGKKMKKKAAEGEEEKAAVKALALYEVVDGKPAKEASIKGIDQIISCYGGRLYYFKSNAGVYCYDIYSHAEACVCKGKTADFKVAGDYEYQESSDGSKFFVKKKITLPEEENGCLDKIKASFKKKKKTDDDNLNPNCLVVVDMKSNACKTVVEAMDAIDCLHGDKVFYTYAYKPEVAKSGCLSMFAKKQEAETKNRLMVYDVASGLNKQVLDDCELHTVCKDWMVYSLWTPNELNRELHARSLVDDKDVVIEENIYEFFDVIDGNVYYTVGNEDYCPLVRNNLEGTNRIEIMRNVQRILFERAGWLYIKKGRGKNAALFKLRTDGKEAVRLCSQFKRIARFAGNYVYYVDTDNSLCVVRLDGKGARVLAEDVKQVLPTSKGLYYTRGEAVSEKDENLSLYMMDTTGRNIRKIVFNIDIIVEDPDDDGVIYYMKKEKLNFKVYLPKKEDKAVQQSFTITRYYRLDTATGKTTLVLTKGWPEDEDKKGCLSKIFKPKKHIYELIPFRPAYKRKGLVNDEEDAIAAAEEETSSLPAFIPAGCANALNKAKNATKKVGKSNLPNNGGKQSAKKVKLPKASFSPIMVVLAILVVSFMAAAISLLSDASNYRPDRGSVSAISIIGPFLLAFLTLGMAAITFGLLPIKNVKRNLPISALYVLVAILFFVTAFWNIGNLPGKGESEKKAIGIAIEEPIEVTLKEGHYAYYSIGANSDGAYVLSISDSDAPITVCVNNNYYYLNEENPDAIFPVYADSTNIIHFRSDYSYQKTHFTFEIKQAPHGATQNSPIMMKIGESVEDKVISNLGEIWYSFTVEESSKYVFDVKSSNSAYVYLYAQNQLPSLSYGDSKDTATEGSASYHVNFSGSHSFNCSLSEGTYYLRLRAEEGTEIQKVSVSKPKKGSSFENPIELTLGASKNGTTGKYASPEYGAVYYSFRPSESRNYTVSVTGSSSMYVVAYRSEEDSTWSQSGTQISKTSLMYEKTTYTFKVYSNNSSDNQDFTITIKDNSASVSKLVNTNSSTSATSFSKTVNPTIDASQWYSFTAPANGYYTFSLSSGSYVSLNGYTSLTSSANYTNSSSISSVNLSKDSTYYIEVVRKPNQTASGTLNVSGTSLSANNAVSFSTSSYPTTVTVPAGGYTWVRTSSGINYNYSVRVSSGSYFSATMYRSSYSSSINYSSSCDSVSNTTSAYLSTYSSSSNYYYYVCLYNSNSSDISVSVYYY